MKRVPFQERKTPWRAVLDIASGCYPAFVWGGPLGRTVPVFHFHDVTRDGLEPYVRYLKENGYHTVTSDAMGRWARDRVHPGPRSVVLCFDDAWASMWTVVTPLLKQYGMQAITYVVPARVAEAASPRDPATWVAGEGEPLATWPEIEAMQASGCVDVQAHTLTHANMFCSEMPADFVRPETRMTLLGRPMLAFGSPPRVLGNDMLGAPIYRVRSRMSDAVAYRETDAAREACRAHVATHGGAAYFKQADWRSDLEALVCQHPGRFETAAERQESQLSELVGAREILETRLPGHPVRQICFPWGVAGRDVTERVREAGYETAVADRLWGRRSMGRRTEPYHIMRLKHSYIFTLPGRGRKRLTPSLLKGG